MAEGKKPFLLVIDHCWGFPWLTWSSTRSHSELLPSSLQWNGCISVSQTQRQNAGKHKMLPVVSMERSFHRAHCERNDWNFSFTQVLWHQRVTTAHLYCWNWPRDQAAQRRRSLCQTCVIALCFGASQHKMEEIRKQDYASHALHLSVFLTAYVWLCHPWQ